MTPNAYRLTLAGAALPRPVSRLLQGTVNNPPEPDRQVLNPDRQVVIVIFILILRPLIR